MPNVQHQISAQAAFLQQTLLTWAQNNSRGGDCQVVHDLQELWMQASQSSQKPIVYVCFNGEEAWGRFESRALTYRVKRNWIVVLKFGRGYTATRGDTLTVGSQSAPPFLDWVDE